MTTNTRRTHMNRLNLIELDHDLLGGVSGGTSLGPSPSVHVSPKSDRPTMPGSNAGPSWHDQADQDRHVNGWDDGGFSATGGTNANTDQSHAPSTQDERWAGDDPNDATLSDRSDDTTSDDGGGDDGGGDDGGGDDGGDDGGGDDGGGGGS
jgi:hypothetical protein